MYYLIKETLIPAKESEIRKKTEQYVAVVSEEEFNQKRELFDMGIDLELDLKTIGTTKAEVNYDSLTGSFAIPDRQDFTREPHKFAFAMDERGIVFINDDGTALQMMQRIQSTKKWKAPGLERFIYDFLEMIIDKDLVLLEKYEKEMDRMEDVILEGNTNEPMARLLDIRSEVLDLQTHYEQLIDFGQELEENENNFFNQKNLRFFRLFTERVMRLQDIVSSLKDHTMQVRDLYHSQLDIKQNRIMTVLTVITTIFMPLTLIVGWYGMNFKYMPELEYPWAYPAVVAACVVIVIVSLIFFKKKKWL
ncbi:MAG TPA: CorA family divalent cation transporter [Lachnospiraceae bacterium]|mgnify:CR=1 FL=1|nr:CorA family divalent cation transporter [Lachnospiraceae bacterium]HPF29468.1 CorA family divalent cation transporter [Lachnospiraceae bacterium]